MSSNIFEIILWLGLIQGVLLSVILVTHKSNQPANRVLGISVFFLSVELFYLIIVKTGDFNKFIILTGLLLSLLFIYVPMIFLYVLKVTGGSLKWRKIFHHFIPLLLSSLYFVPVYLSSPAERDGILLAVHRGEPWYIQIVNIIKPFYGVAYIVFILLLIKNHNAKLKDSFSNLDKINLLWLRNLSFALIIISIIVIIQNVSELLNEEESVLQYFLFVSIAAFIYFIGYFGLKQPEIFSQVDEPKNHRNDLPEKIKESLPRYEKSGLNNEAAEEYLTKLLKLMDERKPYLHGNITLSELASMLSISQHNLSEVINTKLNLNFYDFINSYKVKEVKRLISEDKNMKYSILALGFEAGFSSKSSFYSAFKKETGMTPSQFRKEVS
jgi:AraC-like DNA-binding protein